jgi:hypothetical protein
MDALCVNEVEDKGLWAFAAIKEAGVGDIVHLKRKEPLHPPKAFFVLDRWPLE